MKTFARHKVLLLFIACSAIVVLRLVQAGLGLIPVARAAGELGVMVAMGCVGLAANLVLTLVPSRWPLVGATLLAWGGAVVMPLAYLAHPPAALYQGELGGALRDVATPAASGGGRFRIEAISRTDRARKGGAFVLHASTGISERLLAGGSEEVASTAELSVASGLSVHLFLERSNGKVGVLVRPVPLPWSFVTWAALLVAALAIVVDVVGFRARPRLRGSFAVPVGASVAYMALMDPEIHPGGLYALGIALLSVVIGGLMGAGAALAAALAARASGRSRWKRRLVRLGEEAAG